MASGFLVSETAIREAGESPVFDCGETTGRDLVLTLGITHALERQSIEVAVFDSRDGAKWTFKPFASFTPKYYCGNYTLLLPPAHERYLKAVWRVERWSSARDRPYFSVFLRCDSVAVSASGGLAMTSGNAA